MKMKPQSHIQSLINVLSNKNNIVIEKDKRTISFERLTVSVCFILHKGNIAAFRPDDQLLMRYASAPIIIGINEFIDFNHQFIIQANGEIAYELIPLEEVMKRVESLKLWENLSYILMYNMKLMVNDHSKAVGRGTYEIIRSSIVELMAETDDIKTKINACDYIQSRTNISRSRIMSILKDLKEGGYIDIEKGRLININQLPLKY